MRRLGLIFWLCLGGVLGAQDYPLQWALAADQVFPTQSVPLSLRITGTDQVQVPQIQIPGVQVTLESQGANEVYLADGTIRKDFQASWTLKSRQPGFHRLEGLRVLVAGTRVVLPTLSFLVKTPGTLAGHSLSQTVDETFLIPEEEVLYTLQWEFPDSGKEGPLAQQVRDLQLDLPLLESPLVAWKESPEATEGEPIQVLSGKYYIKGYRLKELREGKSLNRVVFRVKFLARGSGKLELTESSLSFKADGQVQGLLFPPMKLQVTPLTPKGRPDTFSGLLGPLKLTWSLPPGPYKSSEAVPLTLEVTGLRPHQDLDLGVLAEKVLEKAQVSIQGQRALGPTRRIIDIKMPGPGTRRIPAVGINFFDPRTGTYGRASTGPLEFTVEGKKVTLGEETPKLKFAGVPSVKDLPDPLIWLQVLGWLLLGAALVAGAGKLWLRTPWGRRRWAWVQWRRDLSRGQKVLKLQGPAQARKVLESWSHRRECPRALWRIWLEEELRFWDRQMFSRQAGSADLGRRWATLAAQGRKLW